MAIKRVLSLFNLIINPPLPKKCWPFMSKKISQINNGWIPLFYGNIKIIKNLLSIILYLLFVNSYKFILIVILF